MADDAGRPYDPAKDATAQEPLTANEQRLVTRLFGDPFAFPMEFKAWLRGWLEEQFPRIGTLSTPADTGAAGAFVPPAGAILDYGGDVAPGGYVMCDGAEYDKSSLVYQRLFNAIGFKYGTGSDANHFRVPDFQGRVAVGRGAHPDVDAMGDSDSLPVGNRSTRHGHSYDFTWTPETPMGSHNFTAQSGGDADVPFGANMEAYVGEVAYHTHGSNASLTRVGVNGQTEGPAFLVVNKIISLGS